MSIAILAACFTSPSWRLPDRMPRGSALLLMGAIMVGLLAWGSHAVLASFPLSIDERMVTLDMAVFERGQLAAPFPAPWRPFARVLFPAFLLNDTMPVGLVSSYLPMNAFLRMAFAQFADPAFFNPLLALAGGAALFDIARRCLREDPAAVWVVLLVYALSTQMLVNAMTVYSMTGHMALNLVWLAAFLRGGRWGHGAAILTGLVATGLHQIAFHPFFVAPFLLWRLRQGEWKLVALYAAAYACIIAWWIAYPLIAAQHVASSVQSVPAGNLLDRIRDALDGFRGGGVAVLAFLNVLRFLAWQNAALLPLLAAASAVALRQRGLAAVLLSGIILWMTFITIVLPFQGHGWGYRYLHPYLGSFALLGGFGYQGLRDILGRAADGMVIMLSATTAFVIVPMLLFAAHRFVTPYVSVERLVAAQHTPMVLIDTYPRATDGRIGNAIEIVRNDPHLTNRPLRLSSRALTPELLEQLCRLGPITTIDRSDQVRAGLAVGPSTQDQRFSSMVEQVRSKRPNCFVDVAAGKVS